MNDTITPAIIRSRLYSYLHDENFDITPARRKTIKTFVNLTANAMVGEYMRQIADLQKKLIDREVALAVRHPNGKIIRCHAAAQHHDLRCYFDCNV